MGFLRICLAEWWTPLSMEEFAASWRLSIRAEGLVVCCVWDLDVVSCADLMWTLSVRPAGWWPGSATCSCLQRRGSVRVVSGVGRADKCGCHGMDLPWDGACCGVSWRAFFCVSHADRYNRTEACILGILRSLGNTLCCFRLSGWTWACVGYHFPEYRSCAGIGPEIGNVGRAEIVVDEGVEEVFMRY